MTTCGGAAGVLDSRNLAHSPFSLPFSTPRLHLLNFPLLTSPYRLEVFLRIIPKPSTIYCAPKHYRKKYRDRKPPCSTLTILTHFRLQWMTPLILKPRKFCSALSCWEWGLSHFLPFWPVATLCTNSFPIITCDNTVSKTNFVRLPSPLSPKSVYITYTNDDMSGLLQGIEGALQQGYRVQVIFDRV